MKLNAKLTLMIPELRHSLALRTKIHITNTDRIRAAVLVPLFCKESEYYLVFTKRTQHVSTHKGQISFPGGVHDQTDTTLSDTALRETYEEIGISGESVEILGELDDFPTHVSYFVISPFVGLIPWPCSFIKNESETAEILQVPISALLDSKTLGQGNEIVDNELVPTFFYSYDDSIIWGATARILRQFLEIWQSTAAEIKTRGNT